jgi:Tfp pilus assembly protein FimV
VALGLLARVAEPAPTSVRPPAPVVVTVEPGETVWDVAARVAPGRPGAEVAAVAERIVADNSLDSVRLEPGQVLRVAGG